MNAATRELLAERRRLLRARMQAQREQIARRLGPMRPLGEDYPRSRTMRFLSERPSLAIGLLAALATLTAGTRVGRPLGAIVAAARVARSVAAQSDGRGV